MVAFGRDTSCNILIDCRFLMACRIISIPHILSFRNEDVILFASESRNSGESFSIFKSFDGIDAEHGCTELGMKFVEFWFSQSCRTSLDDAGDDASDGITISLDLCDEVFHLLCLYLVWTTNRIVLDGVEII